MKKLIWIAAAALLAAPATAEPMSVWTFLASKKADNSYELSRFEDAAAVALPTAATGEDVTANLILKRAYIGDLPDIGTNDVMLKVGLSSDIAKARNLGDSGLVEFATTTRAPDDTTLASLTDRSIIEGMPFDEEIDLRIYLYELDGDARKENDKIKDLVGILETETGAALMDLGSGNPAVQLGMALFSLVDSELKKSDPVFNSLSRMSTDPGPAVKRFVPGIYVLILENSRKPSYLIDPVSDVEFDGQRLRLKPSADGKKMPTHLIISVDWKAKPKPFTR